ncbi:hypothetical protein [Nocardioides yefusunii]|uniref:Cobyrinic acid a,c-diamide synthase n=1 Tax=Nocardioides yefusunii TaxID=2500546 RepID=A0ABW1R1L1_9ACTN|nr:hypothetical protein [Nocardioides yefusunii]
MARRVSLPAADDLFRPTAVEAVAERVVSAEVAEEVAETPTAKPARKRTAAAADRPKVAKATVSAAAALEKKSSGRVRHDEKMTVYVTSDELLDLEHARLTLRRSHGLAVDRGRVVREAIAMVLADFEANGDDSALVKRLLED